MEKIHTKYDLHDQIRLDRKMLVITVAALLVVSVVLLPWYKIKKKEGKYAILKLLAYSPNGVPKTAPPTGVAGAGSESIRGSSVITIKSLLN